MMFLRFARPPGALGARRRVRPRAVRPLREGVQGRGSQGRRARSGPPFCAPLTIKHYLPNTCFLQRRGSQGSGRNIAHKHTCPLEDAAEFKGMDHKARGKILHTNTCPLDNYAEHPLDVSSNIHWESDNPLGNTADK